MASSAAAAPRCARCGFFVLPPSSAFCPPSSVLAALDWDEQIKLITVETDAPIVHIVFRVTNRSAEPVFLLEVHPSCGCTMAEELKLPLALAPGETGELKFAVDVRGKVGTIKKSIAVKNSEGAAELFMEIIVAENLGAEREARIEMVQADRQAVFKADCATCHVAPAAGKYGRALYAAACGICHDAEHRASIVPELRAVAPRGVGAAAYWEQWIRHGKPGSLMPGFAQSEGGPLDEAQIESLIGLLSRSAAATAALAAARREKLMEKFAQLRGEEFVHRPARRRAGL